MHDHRRGAGDPPRGNRPLQALARVAGLPLIEHVVDVRGRRVGATGLVVVTGYAPEPLEAYLGSLSERCSLPIEIVRNEDWGVRTESPSSRRASAGLRVHPSDVRHLFDREILSDMIAADRRGAALTLAADHAVDNPLSTSTTGPDRAWARKAGSAASARPCAYDAIDRDLHRHPRAPKRSGQASPPAGSGSLSEGVQALADFGTGLHPRHRRPLVAGRRRRGGLAKAERRLRIIRHPAKAGTSGDPPSLLGLRSRPSPG